MTAKTGVKKGKKTQAQKRVSKTPSITKVDKQSSFFQADDQNEKKKRITDFGGNVTMPWSMFAFLFLFVIGVSYHYGVDQTNQKRDVDDLRSALAESNINSSDTINKDESKVETTLEKSDKE